MSIATTTRGAAVHWNGPPLGLTNCDGTRCASVFEAIRRFHVETRGWRDVAYSFLICPGCGEIYPGRGWGVRTAANGTTAANREWHAYMVMCGEGEPFTDLAKQALLRLHAEHRRRFGHGRLTTHRAVRKNTTACAGWTINAWVTSGARSPDEDDDMTEAQVQLLAATAAAVARIEQQLDGRNIGHDLGRIRRSVRAIGTKLGLPVDDDLEPSGKIDA